MLVAWWWQSWPCLSCSTCLRMVRALLRERAGCYRTRASMADQSLPLPAFPRRVRLSTRARTRTRSSFLRMKGSCGRHWTWAASRAGSLPSDCSTVQFLTDGASGLVAGTQSGALFFSPDDLNWQSVFQVQGEGHVYDLTRSSTGMLAATSAGVLVSRDGGITWSPSGRGCSSILSVPGAVSTIAVARDGTVYAGTQARGVAVSQDGGVTWQRLNSGLPALAVRAVVLAGDRVFAVTAHDLVRLQTQ